MVESLEQQRELATFTVTTTLDVVDSEDGVLSLREAIVAAHTNPTDGEVVDAIEFDIPGDDPGHVYYQDDGDEGLVSLDRVVATTEADDASISDIDPGRTVVM